MYPGRQSSEFSSWLFTAYGRAVVEQEQRVLREMMANLFGYHLLQIGSLGSEEGYLEECPITGKHIVGASGSDAFGRLEALPESLPIASDSVDAVLLPHTLDFSTDPRQVLREVERVLIPEGRVIICGFNPWSLWGLRRFWFGSRKQFPWSGHFVSYPRIQDWCSLLGFDIEQTEVTLFRPPIRHLGMMDRLESVEGWGPRILPWAAGVYITKAVKRVSTLTPIKPRWRLSPGVTNGSIEPTTRGMRRSEKNL